MPTMTTRVQTSVTVQNGVWNVEDDSGDKTDLTLPFPAGHFMRAGQNVVWFDTTLRDALVAVVLEAWDGTPEAPAAAGWEAQDEGAARFDGGVLEVNVLIDGENAAIVPVGPPGRYGVRAWRKSITTQNEHGDDAWSDPVQEYLLQFWPLAVPG
jgi:hypothetical protein